MVKSQHWIPAGLGHFLKVAEFVNRILAGNFYKNQKSHQKFGLGEKIKDILKDKEFLPPNFIKNKKNT